MGSLEALGEVFMPLSWLLRVTSNPWHSFALGFQNSNLRLHLSSCGLHFESLHPVSFCLSGKLAIVFRAHPDDLIATFLITSSKTSQKGRILRFLVDITLEASIQFITNTNPTARQKFHSSPVWLAGNPPYILQDQRVCGVPFSQLLRCY